MTSLNITIFIISVLLIIKGWAHKHLQAVQYLFIVLVSFSIISFFTLNIYSTSVFSNKVLFSRLRYLGYAFLCPASLLFVSSITGQFVFLQRKIGRSLILIPAIITSLASLNLIPKEYLTMNYRPFYLYGLSLVQFENGPIFFLHYLTSNLFILLACFLLLKKALRERSYSRDYLILSIGMVCGYLIDLYSVALNPAFRFTMISAGTFLISEIAIFYVSKQNRFFGLIDRNEEINKKFQFQNKLLSLVGHDLNGNIHQLARLSNTLRNSEQNNHELVKVINDTSVSSAELISNLMGWVQAQDSNNFTLQLENIEIKELITQLINSLSFIYPGISKIVFLELESNPLYVKADRKILTSILRNLLTNAYNACMHSSENQSIKIKIKKTSERVFFEISDTGIGLAPAELKDLFQLKKGKKSEKGYGLGFSLIKMMIEIHNGSIKIKSQKNQGTQVYLSISS